MTEENEKILVLLLFVNFVKNLLNRITLEINVI